MKRIEFIAPVESMRGNLSGNQKLLYAEHDNPAYDAPVGRNYARNYRPSFIGAKVAKSGKKYFAVKTKSAAGISTRSKKAMALLGATAAVIKAILADGARKAAIQKILEYNIQRGIISSDTSLRKFMDSVIRPALSSKANEIRFAGGTGTTPVVVKNPWGRGGTATDITNFISNEVLVKFWGVLAVEPIVFSVEGSKGVAHEGDTFSDIANAPYNVLGIETDTYEQNTYAKMNGMYILNESTYVKASDDAQNAAYVLTEDDPTV